MNEPILLKNESHGYDYRPIDWVDFITLRNAVQQTADAMDAKVYLVGSALHKPIPRDIDISVILPLNRYEKMFGELPKNQDDYSKYLYDVFHKSFEYTKYIYDCIDYHLDIKVCPDTWWPEKPKMLLAEPRKKGVF